MCCYRRTNPRHSLLWFTVDGLSYSESAQRSFVPHNYRACDFSTYICLASALWLSRRFDRGIEHIWVKGNMVLPSSSPLCLPRVSQGWCHPEREQKRWALGRFLHVSIHLSECVCLSPDMLWEAMITGRGSGCAEFSGHAALQISLAILHGSRCSNRFHAGLCLVLSSGWHSDLINIHACQMN